MNKIISFVLGIFLLLPLGAETLTVLGYMAADNNLWQNAVQDINMESVQIPDYLQLVVRTDMPATSFLLRLPVDNSGLAPIKYVDTCGNASDLISYDHEFADPELELLIAPNPVVDRSLASARWYLPDGLVGKVELALFNIRGQRVLGKVFQQNEPGEGNWLLSAESEFYDLGRGIYIMKLNVGNKTIRNKLTIL